MKSANVNIDNETAGDDITVKFKLSLNNSVFPSNSTWQIYLELSGGLVQINGSASISEGYTYVTFNIPSANTSTAGIYDYAVVETTNSGNLRTPVRGKIELKARV